jgi:peroxiredoxin
MQYLVLLLLLIPAFAQVTDHERQSGEAYRAWVKTQPADESRVLRGRYSEVLKQRGLSDADIKKEMAAISSYTVKTMDRSAGKDRIGVTPGPFDFDAWINTSGLTTEQLKGKVVLVRWWTDTCPYCRATSPALQTLHKEFGDKGLVVIGVFHPKPTPGALDVPRVQKAVTERGFTFPVAIDAGWRTLKTWWLTGPQRPATSGTLIVDKKGVIRHVHPGMEYHDTEPGSGHDHCQRDMAGIREAVTGLLAE